MAPKRKVTESTSSNKSEPAAKRTTRGGGGGGVSSFTAAKKASQKAAIVILSDEDEDDEELEVIPKKKTTAKPAAKPKAVPVKKAMAKKPVVTKAKPTTTFTTSTAAPASTSTTPLPEIRSSEATASSSSSTSKPKPKVPSPVKKILTWEESTQEWFAEFEDETDKGTMAGEGVERFFDDMGVAMEGPLPFILAWKLGSKPGSFGSYYLADFLSNYAFRSKQISSSPALKAYLLPLETTLFRTSESDKSASVGDYKVFYTFMFNFLKTEGQKSLAGDMATAVWGVILSPRFAIAQEFVEFATELGTGFKGVSMDVWSQLLEFCRNVDNNLVGFNEEDAWPAVIDEFVEWKRAKAIATKQ